MKELTSAQLLQRLSRRAHLLNDFLAVARAGGIRQAAEQAHVGQSALTRRIQELEQALDVQLFERSVQGMALTPFGHALRHHAEMVEMNCTYAATEIGGLMAGASGELRLAAGPAWAYELAPDAVAALKARLPGVKVSMLGRMNEATLPMLDAGRLDVVLGGLPAAHQRSPEICYEALIDVEHLVFASLAHPLHGARRVTPKDLLAHPWAAFNEAVTGPALMAAVFERAGLQAPPVSVDTTSVHFGFRLMADARHLMLLPSTLSSAAREHGLGPLKLSPSVGRYTAGLMYRPSVQRLRAFVEFRQALRDRIHASPPARQRASTAS